MMTRVLLAIVLIMAAAGCATRGPTAVLVPAGRYAETFDTVKDELTRRGFTLERIDARGGVIASAAAESAGFATPWLKTEASMRGELDSFLHRDRRRVTVFFEPEGRPAPDEAVEPGGVDRRDVNGPMTARVIAQREVMHRPGLRLSSVAVRISSVTADGTGAAGPVIVRDAGEDRALAASIALRLAQRLGLERVTVEVAEDEAEADDVG